MVVVVVWFTGKCCVALELLFPADKQHFLWNIFRNTAFCGAELSFLNNNPHQLLSHSLSGTHTCSPCTNAHKHREKEREREERVSSSIIQTSVACHTAVPSVSPQRTRSHWSLSSSSARQKPNPVESGNIRYTPTLTDTQSKHTHAHTERQWLRYKSPISLCSITNMYPHSPNTHELEQIQKKNKHAAPFRRRRVFNLASRRARWHQYIKITNAGGTEKEAATGLPTGMERFFFLGFF